MSSIESPKKNVKATAKVLFDLNFSAKYISELLGIHRTSVYRYAKKPLPADLLHFATEIKGMYLVKQHLLLAKCLNQLEAILPIQQDLKDVTAAIKVLSDNINSVSFNTSPQENITSPTTLGDLGEIIRKNEDFYEAVHQTGKYANSPNIEAMLPGK